MAIIKEDLVLKYSSTPLSNLVYDPMDETNMHFRTKKFLLVETKETANGTMLNGRKYEHTKYRSLEIQIIISADNLNSEGLLLSNAKMNFLKAWWGAKHKYIARVPANATLSYTGELNEYLASDKYVDYDNETTAFSYFEVISEAGNFPITFINDLDMLPEVNFKLTKVLPL